jgi:glycerol kinase
MIDNDSQVAGAHETDDLLFGTVESWIFYVRLLDPVAPLLILLNLSPIQNLSAQGLHISEVSNASRTLLLNIRTLEWEASLLDFFGFRKSILPKLVSSSEVYGHIANGPLKGVPIGGLVGDQQGALIGNKCLTQGEAKCTYGTGAFLLFCTGRDVVESDHGLLSTVCMHTQALIKIGSFVFAIGCVSGWSWNYASLCPGRQQCVFA